MKKLMVMAAVVCAAVAAQATSTVYWNALCENSVRMDFYFEDADEVATLIKTVEADDDGYVEDYTNVEQITKEGIYGFYVIAYDKDDRYAVSIMDYEIFEDDGEGNFSGSVAWDDGSFSPWTVPEPTSGLLMLLGMAGLALKRGKNSRVEM